MITIPTVRKRNCQHTKREHKQQYWIILVLLRRRRESSLFTIGVYWQIKTSASFVASLYGNCSRHTMTKETFVQDKKLFDDVVIDTEASHGCTCGEKKYARYNCAAEQNTKSDSACAAACNFGVQFAYCIGVVKTNFSVYKHWLLFHAQIIETGILILFSDSNTDQHASYSNNSKSKLIYATSNLQYLFDCLKSHLSLQQNKHFWWELNDEMLRH